MYSNGIFPLLSNNEGSDPSTNKALMISMSPCYETKEKFVKMLKNIFMSPDSIFLQKKNFPLKLLFIFSYEKKTFDKIQIHTFLY